MNNKPQLSIYRLCLKSATFGQQKPTFVIKAGKFQKKINTYFIQSDKQRYNYDLLLEKSPETDIKIHCDVGEVLLGTANLKVDPLKNEQPNETLSVMNSKSEKIAFLDCSLKRYQKLIKKPPIRIEVIQANYAEDQHHIQHETESFVVLKYGDANYQTKLIHDKEDRTPVWKETFFSGASQSERIFVQVWKRINYQKNKFQGLVLIDVLKTIGTEKDFEIHFDKKNRGTIKIAIYENKKRTIKATIVETLLKDESRKGTFIRLLSSISRQKFETTPQFTSSKELNFNEGFTFIVDDEEEISALLICNESKQEQLAKASIKVKDIVNKKVGMKLLDDQEKEIGTVYLQFFDHELKIKQPQINQNRSTVSMRDLQEKPVSVASTVSLKSACQLGQTAEQMKSRYASRQSIHDYMSDLNNVLQQGLLKVAKQRPQNPIKSLGLFLVNYDKEKS